MRGNSSGGVRKVRVKLDQMTGKAVLKDFLHALAAGRAVTAFYRPNDEMNVLVLLLQLADLLRGTVR
jgi:hypothetical protein